MQSAFAAAWQSATEQTVTKPAPWAPGGALRILIVDSELGEAERLANQLHDLGHQLRCARRGAEALVVAEELQPNLALIETGGATDKGCPTSVLLRCRRWAEHLVLVGHSQRGPRSRRHRELLHYEFPDAIEIERLVPIYEDLVHGIRYPIALYVTADSDASCQPR